MSLIHRHPGTLNPRVHYRSPFFCPEAARLEAERERAAAESSNARVASEERRAAFAALMGISAQRARVVDALFMAGHQGLSAFDIRTVGQMGQVSPFLADLARRLACFGLHFAARSGAYRAIYRFTPETCAKLAGYVEQYRAGATARLDGPPEPVRVKPSSDADILRHQLDLTEAQAVMAVHLLRVGDTGATTEWLCHLVNLQTSSDTVRRLGTRLGKAGLALEFAATWRCWRLSPGSVETMRRLITVTRALQSGE